MFQFYYGRLLCNRTATIFCVVFFRTLFLRRLCTDFLETLSVVTRRRFVGNRKPPVYLVRFPLKEIRGQNPIFDFFSDIASTFSMSFRSAKKFYNFKTLAYNVDVHSMCVTNLLEGGTYSKGERLLLVKFSFNKNSGI